MNRIDYNTVSQMDLELKRQDILASNLAASSVPGYKNEFVVSQSFQNLYDSQDALSGTNDGQVKIDYSQGELYRTGRRLDFAIQGEGFFKVKTSDGQVLYTRNGTFCVSKDLKLVTDNGFTVLNDADSEIQFSPDDNLDNLEVMPDGMLKLIGEPSQNYTYRQLGKINITQISNKEDLNRLTGNYFQIKKDASVKPYATPKESTVINSMLEGSNVSAIKNMTLLIESSREFEMGSRILKALMDINNREQNAFQS